MRIHNEIPESEIMKMNFLKLKLYNLESIINQYTKPNVPVKHMMKELNGLLTQVGGRPVLEMQLRQLAQRFGFNQIDAEKVNFY